MRTQNTHNQSFSGSGEQQAPETVHVPVLLQEVLDNLSLDDGDIVFDATLGGGGHASAMAERIAPSGILIGTDTDAMALERARHALESVLPAESVHLVQSNFARAAKVLGELGISGVRGALFDLGFSSDQIELSGRGFSFMREEPLLMTLTDNITDDTLTAREIVNTWAEESLADVIYGYGGERYSRRIAQGIVASRQQAPIETTTQLAEIISHAVPASYRHKKIHPATRTFQALRIAVNDELAVVDKGLNGVYPHIAPGGRIAVITFHSLEDRVVKRLFKSWAQTGLGEIITRKPIVPTDEELRENPRARSAKLRVFQKSHTA